MIIVPFRSEHLLQLPKQWPITPEHMRSLEMFPAYTGMLGDKVVACGGVVELWPNRAQAWTCLPDDSGKHFLGIHRAVKRFLDVVPYNRIEAAVDIGFLAGHKWMYMLGFKLECAVAEKYFPNGNAASLYARVR